MVQILHARLTVSVEDDIGLDVLEGEVDAVLGLNGGGRGLGDDGKGTRLPAVDVGAVVEEDRVRRLGQVGSQADLVTLSAGDGPQSGLHARHLHEPLLKCLDGRITFLVVDVVVDRGIQDGLNGVSKISLVTRIRDDDGGR